MALLFLAIVLYCALEAIREFKNATGTDFKSAQLNGVDFTGAALNNCRFDDALTGQVNWTDVVGSRSTIDFTDKRMQLMISRKGSSGIYEDLDLSDRYLHAIDVMKANLRGADLTGSNLQKADLRYANLSNVKAGGTDFRSAKLTGACIQNWTINPDTQFENLECEHIFLSPDFLPESRRPLSGTFEPGDFALLVDKFADTLDFILRRGSDPTAFRQELNQFKQDNPEARIKGMVELDADRVLVQATLPEGSNLVQVYEKFHTQFQLKEQKIQHLKGQNEEKDETISMMERLLLKPSAPTQVLVNSTDDLVSNPQDQSGGDINIE